MGGQRRTRTVFDEHGAMLLPGTLGNSRSKIGVTLESREYVSSTNAGISRFLPSRQATT
jgi:hypothetical protein